MRFEMSSERSRARRFRYAWPTWATKRRNHRVASVFAGEQLGLRSLRSAPEPAPEIEFPGGAEPGLRCEGVVEIRRGSVGAGVAAVGRAEAAFHGRIRLRSGDRRQALRLQDAGRRHAHIVVLGKRRPDQRLEIGIRKDAGPREAAERLAARAAWRGLRRPNDTSQGPRRRGACSRDRPCSRWLQPQGHRGSGCVGAPCQCAPSFVGSTGVGLATGGLPRRPSPSTKA